MSVGRAARLRCAHVTVLTLLALTAAVQNCQANDEPIFPDSTAPSMVSLEHQDRKSRLMRLARIQGILPPEFVETFITPAEHGLKDYPVNIPVLRVVFSDQVFFDFNHDDLKPEAAEVLNTIAESLRRDVPDVTVFVAGYTDAIGTAQYNLQLGMRRAQTVAAELVSLGIASAQVYTVSFGKEVPIADNATDEGRAKNRRVEFFFAARLEAIHVLLGKQNAPNCQGRIHQSTCVITVQKAVTVVQNDPVKLIAPGAPAPRPISGPPKPPTIKFVDTTTVIDLNKEPVAINPH